MPLTRDQALVAAGILALTLNQDLKHPQHVKTAAGAKWYDQPIGSLIIAKPHPHDLKEHQKLVYVGSHAFAVPQQAEVWVPGGTDLNSPASVAVVNKWVKLASPGMPGQWAMLDQWAAQHGKPGETVTEAGSAAHEIALKVAGWKLLPPGDQKVPVALNGKLAAWVPQSWKIYAWSGGTADTARFARDPEGNWHVITPAGVAPAGEGYPSLLLLGESVKNGSLKPATEVFPAESADLPAGAHPPVPQASSAAPAAQAATTVIPKVSGGEITVTAPQISDALTILGNDHSTAVKQPLQKAGHPLWEMDYHAINKAVLKNYPELKVPKGTKSKHVGQVKVSVVHHLNTELKNLAATEAQHAQAAQAAQAQQEHAAHAQEAAGHVVTVAGKEFTTEQVQAALEALEASSHWKVLAVLSAHGSPLAKGTWQGFKSWSEDHPGFGKDAKAAYIAMLKEALGDYQPQADPEMAKLTDEIAAAAKTPNLISPSHAFPNKHEAIAAALIMSYSDGITRYVEEVPGGGYVVQAGVPEGDFFWRATADHHVTSYPPEGEAVEYTTGNTALIWSNGLASLQSKAEKAADLGALVAKVKQLPPEPSLPVEVHGKAVGVVPAGSKFYIYAGNSPAWDEKYIKFPDGTWHHGGVTAISPYGGSQANVWDAKVASGALTEITEAAGEPLSIPPEKPAGLPADVQSLLAKGIGVEVNGASWGALLPGGHLVQHAQKQAQGTGEHSVILQVDGGWSYGLGQPLPAEKASGWWDVTPAGGAVYYPPEKAAASLDTSEPGAAADPGFVAQPGWDELDKLITGSKPFTLKDATEEGSVGAMVAYLLQATTPDKPVRYFEVAAGKPLLPVSVKPPTGAPGHPAPIVYRVSHDHAVAVWGVTGQQDHLDIAAVQAIAGEWLHKSTVPEEAKSWAALQPPSLSKAKELLASFPPGSTLHQVAAPAKKNGAGKPGQWYVQEPDTSWSLIDTDGAVFSSAPAAFYQAWAAEGGLKPVAQKGNITGAVSTIAPDGASGVKVKGWDFPLGSKAYHSSAHSADITVKTLYVKKPDGSWWTVVAAKEPPEPYASQYTPADDLVAKGTLLPVPPEHVPGSGEPGKEIPGFAQAAIDAGTTLTDVDPATMPWAADLPGAKVVPHALAGVASNPHGTVVQWFPGMGWAWEPKNAVVQGEEPPDLSKGWWEIDASKQISYHPPKPAGVTDEQLLDLAHKAWGDHSTFAPGPLAVKLGKAIVQSTNKGAVRYIVPSGGASWSYIGSAGKPSEAEEYYSVTGTKVAHFTDHGATIHALVGADVAALLQGHVPAGASEPQEPEPAVPEGPPISVAWKGKIAGEVPAGSVLYKYGNSLYGSQDIYIKSPDGSWSKVSGSYGISKMSAGYVSKYEGWLSAGKLEEVAPPTPEQVAQYAEAAELAKMIKHGSVGPAAKPGDSEPGALGYAIARGLTEHKDAGTVFVWQSPDDGHWGMNSYKGNLGDYYEINTATLEGTHVSEGEPAQPVPFSEVKAAIQAWVVPNSVVIHGKQLKYGYYYKAKGKAHLEINGEYSSYASAYKYGPHYEWHATDGSHKEMTPAAAAAWLGNGEPQWHAMPKGAGLPPAKPTAYAKAFTLGGSYPILEGLYQSGLASVQVHSDGSGVYTSPKGIVSTKGATELSTWLKEGTLLDSYGTTVVSPGIQPQLYHLFGPGTQAYAKSDLAHLLAQLGQGGGVAVGDHLGIGYNSPGYSSMVKFLSDAGATGSDQQYAAVKGLLHELLEVPQNTAAPAGPAKVAYLKGLPPGISGPQDIFTTDDLGYAKSPVWFAKSDPGVQNYHLWGSGDLAGKIKELSQEFGGGKIVGTHLSGLSKDDRAQWLDAFKQGDMVTVFNLDAKGGKVSPAHPGAPANESTHSIIWGPWAPGETPAQMVVPGQWSAYESVILPKAEIDNYIIKANLQHAEYLTAAEKRAWVTWHRKQNQVQVDVLSKEAHDRWLTHANELTEVPKWTEGVLPAKSYDTYIEDKTPAGDWGNSKAIEEFTEDHKDDPEFKAAWQQWKDSNSSPYSFESFLEGAYYNKVSVIQTWLDQLKAKEEAEKLKPKYHTEPDPDGAGKPPWSRVQDQFGWAGWWRAGDEKFTAHELAVARLAKLWGFRTPETRAAELDGTQGVAHNIPQGGSALGAQPDFTKLTERQLQDIAREHVLGWALDSPSVPGAHYVLGDGSIVSGDHAAAYTTDLGHWDGLALNGQENLPGDQLSSGLYQAIMSHQVSHALADQAYIAAMRAASRISKTPDSRMQEILAPYEQLKPAALDVAGITARKDALPADFAKLWQEVYKKAGWKLPPVPKDQLRFGLYSGFSEPRFFDHVIAAKSFGVPAFFGGSGVEQGHVLVWTELAGPGKDAPRLIRGETGARGSALEALTAWAKANQTSGPENIKAAAQEGGVKNEGTFYKGIINAAKAVSKHAADQNFEGDWTKKQLTWLETHKTNLQAALSDAGAAMAKGPDSKAFAEFSQASGHPYLVQEMAKHYLAQIAKVEEYKASAQKFQPGDLPQWKAPEVPAKLQLGQAAAKPAAQLKVELKKVVRELGTPSELVDKSTHLLGAEDGELHVGAAKPGAMFPYPGQAWHITLPTGEVVEFNDSGATSTPKGQTGRIRFKADATQGSKSLENIRAFLQSAGLPMPEATEQDMELLYWRQLAGILADRKDWNDGPHADVWNTLQQHFTSHGLSWSPGRPGMLKNLSALRSSGITPEEEAELWRAAWAHLTSAEQVAKFTEDGGHLPHLKHWDLTSPETPGGKPVWYHHDAMTPQQQAWLGARKPVSHNFHQGNRDAVLVARTGGLMATEARLRALGTSVTGMSSSSDMSDSNGSAGFLFTDPSDPDHTGSVKIHPRVLAMTQAYGWGSDHFGDISQRKTIAYFDIGKTSQYATHELMIPDGVSLLDDIEQIEAAGEGQRQQIISELKAKGITSIRGVPVEKRVVTSIGGDALAEARAAYKAQASQMFARPETDYEPPPSDVITSSAIETEAEQAGAEELNKPGALSQHVEGLTASADHAGAASEAQVSQMFYGQPTKPPASAQNAAKVKKDLAKRLSEEMTVSDEDLATLNDLAGLTFEQSWGDTDRERIIAGLVKVWASSNSSPIATALQNEAFSLFGLQTQKLEALPGAFASDSAKSKELEAKSGAVLRDFLRAQWASTQHDLSSAEITNVALYRVFRWNDPADWAKDAKVGDVIDAPQQRPLASWGFQSTGATGAGTFAYGAHHLLVKATLPAELLLAYPKSGFGCYAETEFVALDAPGQWEVVDVA